MSKLTLVTGAGGFIGGQLVRDLLKQNVPVRAVDKKPVADWYFRSDTAENIVADLQELEPCRRAAKGAVHVYNLAADMGGMGFIENNKALCMLSVLINTHMLMAAREARRRAILLLVVGLRLPRRQADRAPTSSRSRRTTPIRRCPRTATAGKSCSASACAATSARTSV